MMPFVICFVFSDSKIVGLLLYYQCIRNADVQLLCSFTA